MEMPLRPAYALERFKERRQEPAESVDHDERQDASGASLKSSDCETTGREI
jgi:hypothetical protein